MSQIRSHHLNTLHQFFASETLAWSPRGPGRSNALVRYIEQHGIAHLLYLEQPTQAEQRMLDCNFMAAYIQTWRTFVEPWTAWRVIGVEKARSGFLELTKSLQNSPVEDDAVSTISRFLADVGLYQSGTIFAEWLLERRENTLGMEHLETLNSVGNLALLYESQGRYAEAETLYLRDLEASERTLGMEHPDTLSAVDSLAGLYESQGRYAEAEMLYLRALEASERILGVEHPDTLVSVGNLALLYDSQERYAEAEPLYLRDIEASERILGVEHPNTLASVGNLAGLYMAQRKYEEAEPLYLRVLEAGERTLGVEHPDTLTSVNNLALLYKSQDMYAEAEPLYLRVMEVSQRTLGIEHPSTLISVGNFAGLYMAQGMYEEAEPLYLRVLEAGERTLGVEHPDTLTSVNNLALLYKSQGRYAEAEPLYLRVLEVRERTLGTEHAKTLSTRYSLAIVCLELKHLDLALQHLQKTLEGEISLFGQDSDELIMTHWNLARAYRMKDDPANASVHTLRCWEIEVKHKERLDPDVLYTAVVYLYDLITSNQHSVAREFRAMIYKEFGMLENPSEVQRTRIEQMQGFEI